MVVAVAGCGGDDDAGVGPLRWEHVPRMFAPKGLPSDRVMTGRIRNDSLKRVDLAVEDIELLDDQGRRIAGSVAFLYGFVHGLYPPTREPSRLPDAELLRTGRIARILPGKLAPITVSWRTRPGQERPTRLQYGGGCLPVPPG